MGAAPTFKSDSSIAATHSPHHRPRSYQCGDGIACHQHQEKRQRKLLVDGARLTHQPSTANQHEGRRDEYRRHEIDCPLAVIAAPAHRAWNSISPGDAHQPGRQHRHQADTRNPLWPVVRLESEEPCRQKSNHPQCHRLMEADAVRPTGLPPSRYRSQRRRQGEGRPSFHANQRAARTTRASAAMPRSICSGVEVTKDSRRVRGSAFSA